MSNVIRDVEKIQHRKLENAKRKNEQELKFLVDIHEKLRADIKKTQGNEIVDIKQAHQAKIEKEATKKEQLLAEMRNQLQQSKSMTDKELKALKDNSGKIRNDEQTKLRVGLEKHQKDHEFYLEDMNNRFNETSKDMTYKGEKLINTTKEMLNEKYTEVERENQEKVQTQTQKFVTKFNDDQKNYQRMKDSQDNQFKKERMGTNLRQQNDMKKMTENHTELLEKKDNNLRRGLKDQDLFFEKKYAGQLERHQIDFKTLEDKNKKVIEDLKTSLTKEITKTVGKSDDPFYKFEALKPTLRELPDGVEIRVTIPEHSKQDIQISINGKDAILGYNRRYSDANKLTDGTINKVSKVETFTTRLPTNFVLNAKTVTSSYEDGVMTYVIKKT